VGGGGLVFTESACGSGEIVSAVTAVVPGQYRFHDVRPDIGGGMADSRLSDRTLREAQTQGLDSPSPSR
jgi:hypothetical protein